MKALALVLLAALAMASCAEPSEQAGPGGVEGALDIGPYALLPVEGGIEIRHRASQHAWLNRLLAPLHPALAHVGLPAVVVTGQAVVERGGFFGASRRPAAEVATVAVEARLPRAEEQKNPSGGARVWRVHLRDAQGRDLMPSFGLAREADARALAAEVARVLGRSADGA